MDISIYIIFPMAFDTFVQMLEDIIRSTGEILEGNCMYTNQTLNVEPRLESKRRNLARAAHEAKRVCEIGFNAGHSALTLILGSHNPNTTQYLFFDLGEHLYTRPCYNYLRETFPGITMHMEYGDSRVTIPRWIQANPTALGTFDVVHVDGGHSAECATSDLFAAYLLARPGGIIIVDDIQGKDILPAVNVWMGAGVLQIDPTYEVTQVHPHAVLKKVI